MNITTGTVPMDFTASADQETIASQRERIATLETELAGTLMYIRLCEENPGTWKPTSEGVAIYVSEVKKNRSWRKIEGAEVKKGYRWGECGLRNCPLAPEVKFTLGCKVRMVDEEAHRRHPAFYPPAGTIGDFFGQSDNGTIQVRWPVDSTSGGDVWGCAVECVELVTE